MYIFLKPLVQLHQEYRLEFIDKEIQDYSARHTSSAGALLDKIDRETNLNVLRPRMLSGHVQGRILSMFSHMLRPNLILEIGTYTGYSALCMAEGLAKDGRLITIDINEELEPIVNGYFDESEYASQLDYRIGNALNVIPTVDGPIDLVFIDADKVNYSQYYELVLDKVRPGGYIIADNILWSGKVIDTSQVGDKDTQALVSFNQMVHEDTRVENVLLPVRDGLMILRVL